jgi:CRISPR system Cascade subunit CasE
MIESSKKKNNKTFKIKHLAVKYEGLLQIIDPDKFTKTFIKGIGSAKAFGFGLLSLAKS